MKQKTIKINLPTMSPKTMPREPLKNIINFSNSIIILGRPITPK
jgi:hypothetical protein